MIHLKECSFQPGYQKFSIIYLPCILKKLQALLSLKYDDMYVCREEVDACWMQCDCDMEHDDVDLNLDKDDLPLRANTSHILVRHYVLDMTIHFHRKVISGSIVLFLEPVAGPGALASPGRRTEIIGGEGVRFGETGKTPAESWYITGHVGETGAKFKDKAVTALQDDRKDKTRVGCGVVSGTAEEEGAKSRNSGEAVGVSLAAADIAVTKCQPPSGAGKVHNVLQSAIPHPNASWESTSDGDFTLVLDCCDLTVSKVEALDINSVPSMSGLVEEVKCQRSGLSTVDQSAALIQKLVSIPSGQWREQHRLFSQCSRAPASQGGGTLQFHTDRWSLQVRKRGAGTPQDFPRALRICYETRPEGGSVTWTRDQDNRVCVYTAGSPINNRALFACQEPPVAMSTWQARVRAPSECVVLMSGENQAMPTEEEDTGLLFWDYYVTMPMPASTFTLAVGHWRQATAEFTTAVESWPSGRMECGETAKAGPGSETVAGPAAGAGSSTSEVIKCSTLQTGSGDQTSSSSVFCDSQGHSVACFPDTVDESVSCSHDDYPCRFTEPSAWSQRVVPHRVFAPDCLLQKAQMGVLSLLPRCLAAAHAVLGVHPFPRLDLLIVPAGFSSLGMASPHIVFLSQSVLCADGAGERGRSLCGSRLCHELAHSWFGLAIGARDWTEEWISEGFATYLEDIIWAQAQQLSPLETAEQCDLNALLRWRRLSDELHNSEEQLQVLRPNMDKTGQVTESGSSMVKHALNPYKTFMQVHYLKGYFLLRYLGSQVGEQQFIDFFRLFVKKYHGQLILSQDFLRMLLATFPDMGRHGLTLSTVYAQWLDQPGIPQWLCERSAVWSQARLVDEVKAEVIKWIQLSRSMQGKGRKRKKADSKVNYKEVSSEQLLLLLELLLEEAELSVTSLRSLERTYCLQKQDAEVRHRWCELVVKHGLSQAYRDVEHFLVHDQAMGVYLYGELMVQEDPDQQALARRCLSLVREEMDQSARRVVEEMVL